MLIKPVDTSDGGLACQRHQYIRFDSQTKSGRAALSL